jgi:two-component system chemotaxis response regulator CheY
MGGQRKTVFLVEDHPATRRMLRKQLQAMGYDVVEASDAATAVGRLGTCTPDVICLDLVLPESSGYELCEFIRNSPRHRRTPVLIMSDRNYPEDRAHAAEVGADAFLAKPFDGERLRRRIESLLRGAQTASPQP